MSLLTLIIGLLTTLAPLAGVRLPAPEPAQLPERELVLEPQCEGEVTGRQEERMMAAIQYRCELVGLRGVQVRREGRNFLVRVNSGLIKHMEEYTEVLDELEYTLNERTTMQLLCVHPDSERIVNDPRVQDALVQYETAIVAYEENPVEGAERPPLPDLPARMNLQTYMLAEHRVVSQEDGSSFYEYLVLQRPDWADEEALLVTELEVERAAIDVGRDCLEILLTQRGGETLGRLTRNMEHGRDRLAVLLNGVVVCAPVVHAELGCSFYVTGLSADQRESVVDGLVMPLPVPVKMLERRSVE